MRPISLTLQGFQGYRDSQFVDLSQVDRASITGRVGSGKSSLLDGVNFALFGKVRVPTKDGIIHTACDKASVELEFTERGGRYKVTRSLTRSGNVKGYLWRWDADSCDWITLGDQDGRVGATDFAIRDLIGLTWEAFRASVIVEQGKSNGFAEASAGDRHALLSQIVGLDRYARMAEAANEQRKSVRTTTTRTQAAIDEQTSLLADSDQVAAERASLLNQQQSESERLDQLQKAITDAEQAEQVARARLDLAQQQAHVATAQAAADQTLEQSQRFANDARATFDAKIKTAALRDTARADLEAAQQAKADAEAELRHLTTQGEKSRDELQASESSRSHAVDEIAVIDQRLDGLRHAAEGCFTCGQTLSGEQRQTVIDDLTAQRDALTRLVESLALDISRAGQQHENAANAYRATSASLRATEASIAAALRPLQDAERAEAELPAAKARLEEALASVQSARKAREALNVTDMLDLQVAQATWSAASAAVARAQTQYSQAKDAIARTNTRVAVLDDRIAHHNTAREAIKSLTASLKDLHADEAGWTRLIEAYSPAGVPRMILDTAIADINVDLDAELTALSGGALTASLDTMRATKSGALRNEITLTVVGQDGARVYESFSGGQRFLVDLALHLALTKTLARRNGSALDFLAIDEGWGSIEGEEREAVLRALHDLASENDALLLAITHVQEVADSFPTRIETEMISGTSITTVH